MTDIGIRDISVSFRDNKISNISLVQGDALTRGFDITFVNAKGETLPVDDDYVVELVAVNSKDKDTPYACRHEIVDDKYRVMIPPEALSESGSITIQLVFYQKSTKAVIHTIKQKCPVYQSIGQEFVESNNLYVDITALRLGLEKIEKLDSKLENLVIDIQNKLDNGDFVGDKGEQGIQGEQGPQGPPGEVSQEEFDNLSQELDAHKEDYANLVTEVNKKADKDYTDLQLALKADRGEIEVARGTEPTLGARLDADKAEVSAELAEKVQNFKIKNEVKNGNFLTGDFTGWSFINSQYSSIDVNRFGYPVLKEDYSNTRANTIYQEVSAITSDKLYVSYRGFIDDAVGGNVGIRFRISDYGTSINATELMQIEKGLWKFNSVIVTDKVNGIRIRLSPYEFTGTIFLKDISVINLTQTFGTGNEPTKLEMDELMKIIPNQWCDGELSLTQKQFITWQLNLIRKNTNAIIALGGTII